MRRSLIRPALVAACLVLSVLTGCGEDGTPAGPSGGGVLGFAANDEFGAGTSTTAAWGDADGDGDLDLAIGNMGQNFLYTNDGMGMFTASDAFGSAATRGMHWVDTDGDQDLDLVVVGEAQALIYVNEGGTFLTTAGLSTGDDVGAASGDLNGDGATDIVVATWGGRSSTVFLNNGNNAFVAGPSLASGISVAVLDIDGDLDLDIVLGVGCCVDSSRVYKNDGSAGFTLFSKFGTTETEMDNLSYSDYDDDGDMDLTAGSGDQLLPLWIYDNDGNGNFAAAVAIEDSMILSNVHFGDIDADGDDDLVVATVGAFRDRLAVYVNDGGTFSRMTVETGGATALPINGAITSIALADFDGDNDMDIAATRMNWIDEFDIQPSPNSLFVNGLR